MSSCPDCGRELVEVVDRPSRFCPDCDHFITDEDMERILDALAKEALTQQRDELRSALNRIITILRDLDLPLDVRVNMAYDVAEVAVSQVARK